MLTRVLKMKWVSVLLLTCFALFTSCTKSSHVSTGATGSGNGVRGIVAPGSAMSPKPPLYGVQTVNSLYSSLQVSTGIDLAHPPAAFTTDVGNVATRFDERKNGLSTYGGMDTSGTSLQAVMDVAAQFAVARITIDATKPMSDPTCLLPIDLTNGFTAPGCTSTDPTKCPDVLFNPGIQRAIAVSLVTKLTGVPPTDDEIASLIGTMNSLRPLVTNDASGKKLMMEMLITIVLTANSWNS